MIRVAILASGTGTNAMKLLQHAQTLDHLMIPLVIVNKRASPLLDLVKKEFPLVSVRLVEAPKEIYENEVLSILQSHQIDWCFLAGYMKLVGPTLLNAFHGEKRSRIVNIHPSLLPAYPGLHAYEQAFQANEKISGVTIHFVDAGLDTGPMIAQRSFERGKNDSLDDFITRGKNIEWKLYPEILKKLNDEGSL